MKSLFTSFAFLLIFFPLKVFSQDTTHSSINFGIRYNFTYNYKLLHHTPIFSMNIGQHNVYIGPQATTILKSLGDQVDEYKKKAFGVNFGYRFSFWKRQTMLVPFAQLNFSIYQVKYNEFQKAPPYSTEKKKLIIENTASIGVDFNPVKHFHVFSGVGFGSYGGFFLILDSFTPTCYIGLEYRF